MYGDFRGGGGKAASSGFKHTQPIQIFIPGILTKKDQKQNKTKKSCKKKSPIQLDKILLGKQSRKFYP